MPELNEILTEKIIMKEIDGKIQAIHEYDKMLWALRTGFLTLFFAGWGLMLKSLLGVTPVEKMNLILLMMTLLSMIICIGGISIDLNYVKRKYRVIYALDLLYGHILGEEKFDESLIAKIREFISISGCKANKHYLWVLGYTKERDVALLIFLMPMISLIFGVIVIWKS